MRALLVLSIGALACGAIAARTGALGNVQDAQDAPQTVVFDAREISRILKLSPLAPPPLDSTNCFDGDERAERLGQFLFFDAALSINGEVSCATCHAPELEFSDAKPVPNTLGPGTRRTPSLWNVAQGHWFFHDGRADTLWAQALGPIENPIEMGFDRMAAVHRIAADADLRRAFEALAGELPPLADATRFPAHARPDASHPEAPHARAWKAMTEADRHLVNRAFSDLGKCIAAYERRLTRSDSAFDRFVASLLAGDTKTSGEFTPAARRGLRLFLGKGNCRLCHNGPNFSDGEFHGLGLGARGGGMPTDPGRYAAIPQLEASEFGATGLYSDDPEGERAAGASGLARGPANWGEFKTASLRNVAGRGPYMHAGQFDTLAGVLRFYSTLEGAAPLHAHQEQILTPRDFSSQEAADLEQFLRSLSGAETPSPWFQAPAGPPGAASPERAGQR